MVIWLLVGFKKWHKDARGEYQLGSVQPRSRILRRPALHLAFTDMLCEGKMQYHNYSVLDMCPMWGMWEKEEEN